MKSETLLALSSSLLFAVGCQVSAGTPTSSAAPPEDQAAPEPGGEPLGVVDPPADGPVTIARSYCDEAGCEQVFTFSRDMVAAADLAKAKPIAVGFEPAQPGKLRWRSPRELVFTPADGALQWGHEVKVTIAAAVPVDGPDFALAEPWSEAFQVPYFTAAGKVAAWPIVPGRPRFVAILNDYDWQGPKLGPGPVFFLFDQPVTPKQVARYVRMSHAHRDLGVRVQRPESLVDLYSGEVDTKLIVAVSAKKLPADGEPVMLQYPSVLEDGVPEIDNQEMIAHTRFEFEGFELAGMDRGPGPESTRAPLDGDWQLRFNNPVAASQLEKSLSLSPAAELKVPWVWGGEASVTATLEPGTTYQLTIAKGLTDKLGNRLAKPAVVTFQTHDLAPALDAPRGALTLERGRARVPLRATNVAAIKAELHRFAGAREFIAALRSGGCAGAANPSAVKVAPPVRVNQPVLREVDLAEAGISIGCLVVDAPGSGSQRAAAPLHREVLLQVTGLGVVAKVHAGGVIAWVTRLADATPVAGAEVKLTDSTGKVHATARTDGDGLARLSGAVITTRGGLAQDGFLVVTTAADLAVTRLGDDQLSQPWQYGVDGDVRDVAAMTAAVFTERGVYRPGEKVHTKVMVRDPAGKAPGKGTVAVHIADPRGRALLDRALVLDEYGTVAVDLALAKAAAVGRYSLRVDQGDRVINRSFFVEEYRVPTFEVSIGSDAATWSAKDQARAVIAAHYLHGGDLAARKVSYTVSREGASFQPAGFAQYRFGNPAARIPAGTLAHRETRLDGNGRLALAFETSHPATAGPMRYVVEAAVTDVDRQVYQGRLSRVVHPTDFYLGVRPPSREILATGDTLEVPLVAVAPSGKPEVGVAAELRLERIDHHTTARLAGLTVERENREVATKVAGCKTTTGAKVALCRFALESAGEYRLSAIARDRSRRPVETGFSFTVSGDDPVAWPRFEHERIDLIADQPSYRPGDTARLMVASPFAQARGLLTLERGDVIEHRLFTIDGDAPAIEIPITAAYAPNIYASVVLLRGRVHDQKDATGFETGAPALRMGVIELAVRPTAHQLAVKVRPSAERTHPRTPLTVDLEVADAAGQPVAGQATVMVVDEAVLGLTNYKTPNPVVQLYARGPLGVRTAASVLDLPNSRRARHEQIFPGGDGGDGDGAYPVVGELGPAMRTLFESTAYYAPAVAIDRDGHGRVTFELPDNLTTYRVMAVVVDRQARAGSGDADVLVRKPLMVQPVLPRFVYPGDQLRIEALVYNGTDDRGRVRVAASGSGLAIDGEPAQAPVDGNATRSFGFTGRVTSGKEVVVRFAASLDAHSDLVETRIPILDPGSRRRVVENQQVSAQSAVEIALPADRIAGSASLEVMMSTSRLGRLKESVEYLMDYPNGCIEQTTSRAYPLVVLGELLPDMGVTVDPAKLKEYATAGVKRLLSFQTSQGGLAYWPGSDEPHAFGTAFGLTALIAAKARGYDVPDQALEEMAVYLERVLGSGKVSSEMPHGGMADADTRALFVMTLGRIGRPQPGTITALWRERDKLTAFGMSFLAVAVDELGDGDKSLLEPMLAEVRRKAKEERQEAYFEGDRSGGWSMGSPLRTHAGALLAYASARPGDEMGRKLLMGLLNRQQGGQWGNTQENVFGVMAVAAAVGQARGDAPEVSLAVNDKAIDLALAEAVSSHTRRVRLGESKLALVPGQASPQKIAVTNRSSGPVQVAIRADYDVELTPQNRRPESRGFTVTRGYRSPDGGAIDPAAIPLGGLVQVKLRVVTDQKQNYVAIVDKLPAGLEPLNANLATTETVARGAASAAVARGLGVLSYSEVRDDRVAFYADDLPPGTYEFEYLARATTPGSFLRPAATAEAMYQPESYGRSAIDDVVVK